MAATAAAQGKLSKLHESFDQRKKNEETEDLEIIGVRYKPESLDALCKLTKFSRKELQLMYRGFKQGCPNGIVSLAQFKEIYCEYFPQGDPTRYAHFVFNTFDRDGNGQISFEEFAMALSVLSKGTTEEKLKWIFELYDINRRGYITREDLYDVVRAIYDMVGKYTDPAIEERTVPEHVEEMFKVLCSQGYFIQQRDIDQLKTSALVQHSLFSNYLGFVSQSCSPEVANVILESP